MTKTPALNLSEAPSFSLPPSLPLSLSSQDSVFGGSPVMQTHARMPSPPPSVSTASLLQRSLRQPASESRQSIKGHSEWGQSHPAAGSAAFASPSKDDDIVSGYNSSRQVTEGDSGGRSKEGGVVYMPGSSGGNSDTESLGVRQGSGIPVNSVQEDVDIPTAVVAVPHVHGVVREGREGGAIEEQQGRNIPTESDREEEEERKKEAGGRDGEGGREREDAVSSGENTGAEDTVEGVEEEAGLGVELEGGGSDSRIKMDTIQEEEGTR